MQRKRTDDTDRFMRAIAAFSASPEQVTALGRAIHRGEGSVLQAMLTEINETVLRRTLIFRRADSAEVTLDVGERRLLAVISTEGSLGFSDALCNQPLEEKDAAAVFDFLTEFCSIGSDIFLRSQLPDPDAPSSFGGLSVRELMAQQDAPRDDGVSSPLAAALEASKTFATAFSATSEGEETATWGEPSKADALQHIGATQPGSPGSHEVRLWHGGLAEGHGVLLVRLGQATVRILCKEEALVPCFALWHKAVTSQKG